MKIPSIMYLVEKREKKVFLSVYSKSVNGDNLFNLRTFGIFLLQSTNKNLGQTYYFLLISVLWFSPLFSVWFFAGRYFFQVPILLFLSFGLYYCWE